MNINKKDWKIIRYVLLNYLDRNDDDEEVRDILIKMNEQL
jgi:hypothetical protein